jgi:hypothetical protein
MIADVARLGYLQEDWNTLDATYGLGTWWKLWRPLALWTNDINPESDSDWNFDFRDTSFATGMFDAIAFDPPYVCVGGRSTSGLPGYHARYGMTDAPTTPGGVQDQINDGLIEMSRLVKPGGIILTKCQDYVSSGKMWTGTYRTQHFANLLGLDTIDRLEHIGDARPQPSGRRQVHARRNLSTLLVFRG